MRSKRTHVSPEPQPRGGLLVESLPRSHCADGPVGRRLQAEAGCLSVSPHIFLLCSFIRP